MDLEKYKQELKEIYSNALTDEELDILIHKLYEFIERFASDISWSKEVYWYNQGQ